VSSDFRHQYGPWALVAGASEGLGAEFARQLAARGLNLLLVARRADALAELATQLQQQYRVEVETLAIDLARPDLLEAATTATASREIGLLVYNAALGIAGSFLSRPLDEKLRSIDISCRGPLILAHLLGPPMVARRRGGIILMTSLAGTQGTPLFATYSATKAFNLVFAEALWDELRRDGVDVLACRAGSTRTPGYLRSQPSSHSGGLMEPTAVVSQTLAALGKRPSLVTGWKNRLSALLLDRLLPRSLAVQTIGAATRRMYGPKP
jgi:short-subunit dehydrogenase